MADDFSTWLEENGPWIKVVQEELSEPLSEDLNRVTDQLRKAESQYARLTTLQSYARGFLEGGTFEAWLMAKGTVPEKEDAVKAAVRIERRTAGIIEGLCRAISQRISLGQSLLRLAERERRQ